MKQTNEEKLARSREILKQLKEARGGTLLLSHLKMGSDPNLAKMFLDAYENNSADSVIPKKYRELIVMALGMAAGAATTVNVHAKLAEESGATVDELTEVIRIVFFTHGATRLLPALEQLDIEPVASDE